MLTPNSPIGRLRYVLKQYDGTKNQYILPDVVRIALYAFGRDQAAAEINMNEPPLFFFWRGETDLVGTAFDKEYERRAMMGWLETKLPPTHEWDTIVPWVARELGRLYKAYRRQEAALGDYEHAVGLLETKTPAIAMWSKQENVDLNKTSLAEALEAVETFVVDIDTSKIPQGDVVYRFDDGFTIQDLRTEEQLEAEGEVNQHCVGGYCSVVSAGNAIIYSLRDPKGVPKVTIEWVPFNKSEEWVELVSEYYGRGTNPRELWGQPAALIDSEFMKLGRFVQIRGKQNEIPVEKYRRYVQQFIKEKFGGDALGMLMVALPGQKIEFKDATLQDVDFTDDVSFSGVPLSQADWRGGRYIECLWPDLEEANFDGAEVMECRFEGDLFDCSFADADFTSVRFMSEYIKDCDFSDALIHQSLFGWDDEVEINRSNFKGSKWFNSTLQAAEVIHCDLSNAQFSFTTIAAVSFENCDMAGVEVDSHSVLRDLQLEAVDLSDVAFDTVTQLLTGTGALDEAVENADSMSIELPEGYEEHVETALSANGR